MIPFEADRVGWSHSKTSTSLGDQKTWHRLTGGQNYMNRKSTNYSEDGSLNTNIISPVFTIKEESRMTRDTQDPSLLVRTNQPSRRSEGHFLISATTDFLF